jgi:voltage-gated potassium channel
LAIAEPGLSSIESSTVLEANTPAGKIYKLVIFGAILLSMVVLLLEPNPLDLVQDSCLAVFAEDFVLHLAVVPSPRKTLFSFTGLIDLSAVLFFFVLQGVTPLL